MFSCWQLHILGESVIVVTEKVLRNFWSIYLDLFCQVVMRIDFAKFRHDAICPTKDSANVAGFNLCSVEDVIVPPFNIRIGRNDIGFKIPRGCFRKVHSRSCFALQFKNVGGGVIDADYRGPVAVIFFNWSNYFLEDCNTSTYRSK